MKIFMTGWQGFIGSHLRETLQQHEITLLQNDLRDHAAVQEELVKAGTSRRWATSVSNVAMFTVVVTSMAAASF